MYIMEINHKTIMSERANIDAIDKALVHLLELRLKSILAIARIKRIQKFPTEDKQREQRIFEKIKTLSNNPEQIIPFFQAIINESKKLQEKQNGN